MSRVHNTLGRGEPLAVLFDFDDIGMPRDERETVVRRGLRDRAAREKAAVNPVQNLIIECCVVVVEVDGEAIGFRTAANFRVGLVFQCGTPDLCQSIAHSLPMSGKSVKAPWVVASVPASAPGGSLQ
ncbi:hypothetical protein [Sinosporangium album]|uniref:hypothetical protein n=1 Tax=Sinosporangium album TaxID=504805 RepID=UPI00115FD66E|nr:hypothetical protein [Sinosporangium album]